jgi:class 3 adenylate cyclase
MTDVENSAMLWERHSRDMSTALARHDRVIESLVARHYGIVVKPRGEGDSRFAVFSRPTDALAAACAIQLALYSEPWSIPSGLRVRIAVHTGESVVREGDYYGAAVNRCARIRALGHGGQTLVSEVSANLVGRALPPECDLRDLGTYQF